MTPAPPPAGWYADPHRADRLRWWDGHAWTDRYARPPAEEGAVPVSRRSLRDAARARAAEAERRVREPAAVLLAESWGSRAPATVRGTAEPAPTPSARGTAHAAVPAALTSELDEDAFEDDGDVPPMTSRHAPRSASSHASAEHRRAQFAAQGTRSALFATPSEGVATPSAETPSARSAAAPPAAGSAKPRILRASGTSAREASGAPSPSTSALGIRTPDLGAPLFREPPAPPTPFEPPAPFAARAATTAPRRGGSMVLVASAALLVGIALGGLGGALLSP